MNAILAVAYRDVIKFVRDPARIVSSLIFPVLFIGIFGGTLGANLHTPYAYIPFVFTGVYAQTLFQSAALGIVSLLEDRENDFTQEIFVSPVSRYAIVAGKILGEALVAMVQGIVVIVFGVVIGVHLSVALVVALLLLGLAICFLGGAFGLVILANLGSQRAANQIFPFIFFPQFFLAGLFAPIHKPWYLVDLSYIIPLRYAVDLIRGIYYAGDRSYAYVVLASPIVNAVVMVAIFVVCLVVGTALFVRNERNR